jgi:uroporphyrinogen decarboxylase
VRGRDRVDRALRGEDVDRPPYSAWQHFRLEKLPGEHHARATLDFHRRFRTDFVKVMRDYRYPRPETGAWHALKVLDNPFPEQIRALEIIRDGLGLDVYFVETIRNSFNQAVKLASMAEVQRLKREEPQTLLDALEVITKSQVRHALKAMSLGASGLYLAIDCAGDNVLSREEYAKFSEPFDRMILDAVRTAPLNMLHLHGESIYLDLFYTGWPVAVLSHSVHSTGVSMAEMRKHFDGVLMGGIDEGNFRSLSELEMREQAESAAREAGAKFVIAPGCSVPDDTTEEELARLPRALGA